MTTHKPHWLAGSETNAHLAEQSEAGERLAHQVYGQLVKHFGLGSSHTFSSWDKLPEDEKTKWVAALMDVRQDEAQQAARLAERNAEPPPH